MEAIRIAMLKPVRGLRLVPAIPVGLRAVKVRQRKPASIHTGVINKESRRQARSIAKGQKAAAGGAK